MIKLTWQGWSHSPFKQAVERGLTNVGATLIGMPRWRYLPPSEEGMGRGLTNVANAFTFVTVRNHKSFKLNSLLPPVIVVGIGTRLIKLNFSKSNRLAIARNWGFIRCTRT
jgi:hypothetical protein